MTFSQLCIPALACIVTTFSLTGCGSQQTPSDATCNQVTSGRDLFDGEWTNIGSSNGQQELDVTAGWEFGGNPTSPFWASAETAMSAGFNFFGAPVAADIATGIIHAAQNFFDPEVDAKKGTSVYKQSFVETGTVWQWQYNNGAVCGGTHLKTMNFMLTPMDSSDYPPCCLPSNFASTDVHGACQPGTPVSDPKCNSPSPTPPPSATAACVKNSPDNSCGICATESDCGGTGSTDCDGGACCQLGYVCTHCEDPNNCYHESWKVPCSMATDQKACEDSGGTWEGAVDSNETKKAVFQSGAEHTDQFVA